MGIRVERNAILGFTLAVCNIFLQFLPAPLFQLEEKSYPP
jgi:hypothetical protein